MKVLRSNKENVWIEVDSTEKNGTLGNFFEQKTEIDKKKSGSLKKEKKVAAKDQAVAQKIYEAYKPKVEEKGLYEFVHLSILFGGLRFSGFLNYRMNGEQEQVSFEGFFDAVKQQVIKKTEIVRHNRHI